MALDGKTLQDVIRVPQTEQLDQRKKLETIHSELEKLFDLKYANISRFSANNFVVEVNQLIKITDSFINENETQANSFLREAVKYMTAGDDAKIHPNDPYLKALREIRGALWNIFVALNYRDLTFEALIKTQKRLLDLVEQTKDIEVETRKLDSEKSIYTDVVNILKQQLTDSEKRSADREKQLMDQVLKLSGAVQRIESKVQQEIDTQTEGKEPMKQEARSEEELPEGELTDIEKNILRTTKSKKRAIEYLSKRHPNWRNSTIAQLLGVDEAYVSTTKVSE